MIKFDMGLIVVDGAVVATSTASGVTAAIVIVSATVGSTAVVIAR